MALLGCSVDGKSPQGANFRLSPPYFFTFIEDVDRKIQILPLASRSEAI